MTTTTVDYLVVGSGLTGAVIARTLADVGREVLVVDRRSHLGGNVHDFVHESGIRVHTYGPHYFRTNSAKVWDFVNRFSSFYRYEAVLASWVDGRYEHWPVTAEYVRRVAGDGWKPAFEGLATNFEEASLAMMPEVVYRSFVKGYTEKQWGVPARNLAVELAGRFDVRTGDDVRLKPHRHQGIPVNGYSALMTSMLDGIPTVLECDFLARRDEFEARRAIVYTGPIDEYFGFDLGRLAYRGQRRQHEYHAAPESMQPFGQVNNPDPRNGPHVRTLEWRHMLSPEEAKAVSGTVVTREVPFSPTDPNEYEYPFPDLMNKALFEQYKRRARELPGLLICGRLGEYRYYDMDQAIARALLLVGRMLAES